LRARRLLVLGFSAQVFVVANVVGVRQVDAIERNVGHGAVRRHVDMKGGMGSFAGWVG